MVKQFHALMTEESLLKNCENLQVSHGSICSLVLCKVCSQNAERLHEATEVPVAS